MRGWSDEQKRLYVIADNQLALNADWDEELLALELGELRVAGLDISLSGFDADALAAMLDPPAERGDPEAVPEVPVVARSRIADVGLVSLGVEVVEAGALGKDEALPLKAPTDAGLVVAVLLAVRLEVVVPKIRDVLQEQHHEDVVLVLTGIDGAPERVAGGPSGLIDLLLCDLIGHQAVSSWSVTGRLALSESLVGALATAVATSLPELVTTIAAVRRGALQLAVGGIIGGNTFDTLFLTAADVAYRDGSLYHAAAMADQFWNLVALLMTGILLGGLIVRQRDGPGRIGVESVALLLVYAGAIALQVMNAPRG